MENVFALVAGTNSRSGAPQVGAIEAGAEADGMRHGQLQNHVTLHALCCRRS